MNEHPEYRVVPLPRLQRRLVDWLAITEGQHLMHALLEIDVTEARARIRAARAATGDPVSLTAFVVSCFARAVAEHPSVQAFRAGSRLVVFDDVDVAVPVEHEVEGDRIPVPHVIRLANRRGVAAISREIRRARTEGVPYGSLRRMLPAWLLVPAPIRRRAWTRFLADAGRRRRLTGTAFVTAVGMFGSGAGWGVPSGLSYSVGLTVGGVARRPGIVRRNGEERIEPRSFLCLTVTFDHDVVDGAPAARFVARLSELLERAAGLPTA